MEKPTPSEIHHTGTLKIGDKWLLGSSAAILYGLVLLQCFLPKKPAETPDKPSPNRISHVERLQAKLQTQKDASRNH